MYLNKCAFVFEQPVYGGVCDGHFDLLDFWHFYKMLYYYFWLSNINVQDVEMLLVIWFESELVRVNINRN